MKSPSWIDCCESNNVITMTPDVAKSRSLQETAEERIKFVDKNELNENTARFVFEGYYTSALEILHALIILKGYKVNNHICLGFYLRDELK